MAKKLARSDCFYSLKKNKQERYLAKLRLFDGVDPYTLRETDFTQNVGLLPSLRWPIFTMIILYGSGYQNIKLLY